MSFHLRDAGGSHLFGEVDVFADQLGKLFQGWDGRVSDRGRTDAEGCEGQILEMDEAGIGDRACSEIEVDEGAESTDAE